MINIQDEISRHLKDFIDFNFKKQMSLVGIESIRIINDRVEKGVDVDGAKFKEYSPKYKKTRRKKGLGTKPNLQVTGEMMNSLDFNVKGGTTIVEFPKRNHKKSKTSIREIAEVNDETREFLDHNEREEAFIWNKHIIKPFSELLK